ncbi:hypothetical protein ACHAWF_012492 [Thalassiosira exigua]
MGDPAGQHGVTEASPLLSPSPPASAPSASGVSVWSYLTFGWYTPVLANIQTSVERGQQPNIEKDEGMPPLPDDNRTDYVRKTFQKYWKQEVQERPEDPSILRALLKAFMGPFILACFISSIGSFTTFIGPVVLQLIVPYLLDPESTASYGLMLCLAAFLSQLVTSLCTRHSYYLCCQVGIRVRTALIYEIFHKALRIDSTFYQDHPTGQVTNLMSTDVSQIAFFIEYLINAVTAPIQMIIAVCYLWFLLGFSSLGGIVTLAVSVPLSTKLAQIMGKYMMTLMKARDDRIQCNQEILSSMNIVKFQAWEDPFREKTEVLRMAEVKQLFNYKLVGAYTGIVYASVPVLVAVLSFGLYVTIGGHVLDAATALTAITIFGQLKIPLFMLPMVLTWGIESQIALKRIQTFLLAPDLEPVPKLTDGDESRNAAISIKSSTYSYHGFQKQAAEDAKLGLKHQVGRTEQELLLVKAKLGDIQERLAKLEGHHQMEYGSSDMDHPTDSYDGFKDILSLRRVNFTCNQGEFVAVVGGVGSGKSTLLKAILGEIHKVSGESGIRGSVAYFEQDPFIMNDTVKGNVLFGKSNEALDENLYRLAIKSACLKHDLDLLADGDQTLIGEKGTGLSGGQQARVAIGRAVYRDADISLLDDCLRAVDAHVGRELFDNCIVDVLLRDKLGKGTTRKRTVILVTNALQYLSHPRVDKIVVMKDGLIVESGSYSNLMGRKDSHFKSMLGTFNESMANEDENEVMEEGGTSDDEEDGDLEDIEETEEDPLEDIALSNGRGQRRRSSIMSVSAVRALSSGVATRASTASTASTVRQRSSRRLSVKESKLAQIPSKPKTSEAAKSKTGKVEWEVYKAWVEAAGGMWIVFPLIMLIAGPQVIDLVSRYWLTDFWGTRGKPDHQLFYLVVYTILGAFGVVVSFFNSIVPVVFNLRASKSFFTALLNSMLSAPMSFFDTTPTGKILNRFSQDINTIDEMLIGNFMSVMGMMSNILVTIVVLVSAVPILFIILPFLAIYYKQQHAYFSQSNRELKRIESASKSPIYALFAETLNGYCTIRAFEAEPALLSRLIDDLNKQQHAAYLLKVGNCWLGIRLEFIGTVLVTVGCLANMVAIERVQEYIKVEKEAPHHIPADKALDKEWPSNGQIEFKNYQLRYRPDLPLVLKGVDIIIPSRAKVGIVGRTGSGKSTLMNGLTRLVEPAGGKIILDGIDITTVGLAKLRSNIAIVPQDPVLFSGTVRTNLDPFGQHHDDRLMDALDRVGLCTGGSSSAVKSLEDKVEQDGSNFSAGQRQLLVIARALLGGASVVICDEATSSIDAEADSRIQRVFRDDFAHATTLTVAHRLNTIMDSTHILVMSDGKALEFDSPSNLLAKGGLFKDLVDKWEEEH